MTSQNAYYHLTYRNRLDIIAHVELEQLGRNRWRCVFDGDEFIMRTRSTEPFVVLTEALQQHNS